jgi:putative DNA primase/helicase
MIKTNPILLPDHIYELRALHTHCGTISGYFSDKERLYSAADEIDGKVPALYTTLNPVKPDLLARAADRLERYAKVTTTDADVLRRLWLLIDCDAKRPANISSTDAEHQAALDRAVQIRDWLHSLEWPDPVMADSGNGAHLLYKIDMPNDPSATQMVKAILEVLALRFDDEVVVVDRGVFNAARITKLYGSMACKGDDMPDRPHRRSAILAVPLTITSVPPDLLQRIAAQLPHDPTPTRSRAGATIDLRDFIARHDLRVSKEKPWNGGTVFELETCPFNPEHTRSSALIQFPSGAVDFTCHHNSCQGHHWAELRARLEPDRKTPRPSVEMADLNVRCTDVGNAELFALRHRDDVRFCYGLRQWLVWDEQRWKPDMGGRVMALAKKTARSFYRQAELESDESRRKALAKWAAESETERRLKSMLSLAQSEPGIAIEADRLDVDPRLFNVLNGTLDLCTGILRPARRSDFITKLAPVEYQPNAICPEFERLLNRLFKHVPAVREYLQRIFGYTLTGLTSEQCFFIFYGVGANGKSTLLRALLDLLGEYATTTRPETFLTKRGDGIPNDVAALAGARFVVSLESEQGKRLAEGLVKGVTGGDKMSARFLHKEFFAFAPQLKFFIGTNHKPTIRGTDHAMWRRVRCVPFEVVIPDDEQDKLLPEKLRSEFSGILNWLVQGCLAWQRDGLGPPFEVQKATAAYRAEQDILGVFLKDRCVLEPPAKSTKSELFESYIAWCEASGERHRLTLREFGKALRELGMVDAKVGNAKGWIGLRLRSPLDVESDDDELVAAQPEVFADEN